MDIGHPPASNITTARVAIVIASIIISLLQLILINFNLARGDDDKETFPWSHILLPTHIALGGLTFVIVIYGIKQVLDENNRVHRYRALLYTILHASTVFGIFLGILFITLRIDDHSDQSWQSVFVPFYLVWVLWVLYALLRCVLDRREHKRHIGLPNAGGASANGPRIKEIPEM